MKTIFFLALQLATLIFNCAYAQKQGTILVVSTQPCDLFIDGELTGKCEANKPLKVAVGTGDHIIQGKAGLDGSTVEKMEIVTIEEGIQKVVKFTFDGGSVASPTAEPEAISPIQVADVNFTIDGSIVVGTWLADHPDEEYPNYPNYYYVFEKGDEIVLSVSMTNKNGTNAIEVSTYPDGTVKYSNLAFQSLENVRIKVEARGVYRFSFSTNAALDRNCRMKLQRIPASSETRGFHTEVRFKKDTIFTEVLDRSFNVSASQAKGYCEINLPKDTDYWVYWIGVGQETTQQFQSFGEKLPNIASLAGISNPLVFFGLGVIGELPKLTGDDDITYKFMDKDNLSLYLNDSEYKYFTFGYGTKVISEYRKIPEASTPQTSNGKLYMTFYNDNILYTTKVTVKIVAFDVIEVLDLEN